MEDSTKSNADSANQKQNPILVEVSKTTLLLEESYR